MSELFDLVVSGGTCVTPGGPARLDIGVRAGLIAALAPSLDGKGAETLPAAGQHVLPGLIDTQVHFREPGLEHKEDLACGTAAAVAGGITTVFEMPNTHPGTVNQAALADKLQRAAGRAWCDYAFFVGATPTNAETLAALETLPGCCGVKIFMGSSTGDLLVAEDADLRRVLASGRRRVAVHAEDEARLRARKALAEGGVGVSAHPIWRDEETALKATRRVVEMAEDVGRPVHVLHVTTAAEIRFLALHKRLITVEVTPQHLTLQAPDCYDALGTLAQMNPPIRDARHRAALWDGVAQGIVDVIGSDHAPHTLAEKAREYPASPSGMPGVQTMVPLMLDNVNKRHISLERMVDLLAAGPARIYGVRGKGRLAVGYDADLTLVDLRKERVIANGDMRSKSGWTPFDGRRVTGWPTATVLRGEIVMREDELVGDPVGRPVEFPD